MKYLFAASLLLFWMTPGRLTLFGGSTQFIQLSDFLVAFTIAGVFVFREINFHERRVLIIGFVVIAIVRVTLGFTWQPAGLSPTYHAGILPQAAAERSWGAQQNTAIAFDNRGFNPFNDSSFSLDFFNDWRRFNQPDRKLAFSAEWRGFLLILPEDPEKAILRVSGGNAQIRSNDTVYYVASGKSVEIPMLSGIHQITLNYKCTLPKSRGLTLSWSDTGQRIPVSRFVATAEAFQLNKLLSQTNLLLHVAWLGLFIIVFRYSSPKKIDKEKLTLTLLVTLSLLYFVGRIIFTSYKPDSQWISPGIDGLLYETQAREILMDGWLNGGTSGQPFQMNILYRYFLVLLHLVVGKSITMVIFVQQLSMLGILLFIFNSVKKLYNTKIASLVLLQSLIFYQMLFRFPKGLLDTTFAIGFSSVAILLLLYYGRHQKISYAIGAGILLSVASLLRSNFLVFIPFAAAWMIWQHNNKRDSVRDAFVLAGIVAFSLVLVGLRNWHIANLFTITPQTGLYNLWLGNRPPEAIGANFFVPPEIPSRQEFLAQVLEYLYQRPWDFMNNLWLKTGYLFGIDLRSGFKVKWYILLPWLLTLAGYIRRIKSSDKGWGNELLLLWMWVITNLCVLIAIFPWGFGWRLMGPVLPMLYLITAIYWRDVKSSTIPSSENCDVS